MEVGAFFEGNCRHFRQPHGRRAARRWRGNTVPAPVADRNARDVVQRTTGPACFGIQGHRHHQCVASQWPAPCRRKLHTAKADHQYTNQKA